MTTRAFRLVSAAALLVTAGCRSPSAPRVGVGVGVGVARGNATSNGTSTSGSSSSKPGPPKRVVLRYDLFGRSFPLPLVRGSVGGELTWMLIDTGANSHVVAAWLARKAKLDSKDLGDVGTDHAGHTIVTSRADNPSIVVDGWGALTTGPTLVTEVPEAVAHLGIGAFLSPQQLATAGDAVILDLARGELRTDSPANAELALRGRGVDLFTKPPVTCEDTESPIKGLAFVVPAQIEGKTVALLLDTGAHHSDLLASTSVGKKLAPRSVANKEQVYAASGKITTRTLKGAKLEVGAWSGLADVDVLPGETDPSCPRDGVLAMDVLQKCVLVFHHGSVRARCGT